MKPATQTDEDLPTYEEVLKQDTAASQQYPPQPPRPVPQQQQPPQQPPRPPQHYQHQYMQQGPGMAPAPAPGAMPRPNTTSSTSTSTSTNTSTTPSTTINGRRIPWVYPAGYYCKKCGNTGYKISSQRQCRKCWSRFCPPIPSPPPRPSMTYSSVPVMPMPFVHNPNMIVVRPGDSRIGGNICPRCNGSGRVRFFLDKEICSQCQGLGRTHR